MKRLLKHLSFLTGVMDRIHESQVGEILPHLSEPEPSTKTSDARDDNDTDQSDVYTTSSDEDVDHKFERANAWRLLDLSWCKCGHCSLCTKAVECFCCHDKALEYEYEVQTARYILYRTNYMQYLSPTLYIKLIFHD